MHRWVGVIGLIVGIIGGASAQDTVPTDFTAAYIPLDQLEQQLGGSGFAVVGKHRVAGNSKYTSVLYTCEELKQLARDEGRGFIAVLRVLHNAEDKELVVSNPEYYIRAYYQKAYRKGSEASLIQALEAALGPLEPTADALKAKKLAKYKFMVGMPTYDDFVRVAEGPVEELAQKLEANAKERIVFKLDIKGDGSALLYGVGLPDGIEKFNEKLETMGQSHLLPYTVLIENGEANILHAKFYLALSFPRLTMTEFMKIMSVPGKIEDAFKTDFK